MLQNMGGGGAWVNTWVEHGGGGLKTVFKNTGEGVDLLAKLPAAT